MNDPMPADPDRRDAESRPADARTEPRGQGCLVAAGMMSGPVVGWFFGQVALGLVAGLVLGAAAAVAMTLRDNRRSSGRTGGE